MKKYRKKHIFVEAVQWDGRLLEGVFPIAFFKDYEVNWHYEGQTKLVVCNPGFMDTEMTCYPGGYIIKYHDDRFGVCAKDKFNELFEAVDE